MADEEYSRSSAGGEDGDYEENELDNGVDYEGTLDEEESLEPEDYANELKDLEDEGGMSIEELRQKYGLPPTGEVEEEEEQDDDVVEDREDQPDSSTVATDPEASSSNFFSRDTVEEDEADAEEDKDYAPPDPWRKEPRVDPVTFQTTVPEFQENYECNLPMSLPLWSPDEKLSTAQIDYYLSEVIRMRTDIGQIRNPRECETRDDEDALCSLFRNGYDVEAAKGSFPFPHINQPTRTVRQDALRFDDNEKAQFIQALLTIGKDFDVIRRRCFPYRKLGELIDFYYSWKKTESYFAVRRQMAHAHYQHSDLHLLISNQHHFATEGTRIDDGLSLEQVPVNAAQGAEKVTDDGSWRSSEDVPSC